MPNWDLGKVEMYNFKNAWQYKYASDSSIVSVSIQREIAHGSVIFMENGLTCPMLQLPMSTAAFIHGLIISNDPV